MSKGKELRKPKSKGIRANNTTAGASVEDLLAEAPNAGVRVGKTETSATAVPKTHKGSPRK